VRAGRFKALQFQVPSSHAYFHTLGANPVRDFWRLFCDTLVFTPRPHLQFYSIKNYTLLAKAACANFVVFWCFFAHPVLGQNHCILPASLHTALLFSKPVRHKMAFPEAVIYHSVVGCSYTSHSHIPPAGVHVSLSTMPVHVYHFTKTHLIFSLVCLLATGCTWDVH